MPSCRAALAIKWLGVDFFQKIDAATSKKSARAALNPEAPVHF
jgi:hypothetical protein